MKNTIFAPIHCPRGEIGRHASLRGWCLQWCAGSNPVVGTKKSVFFFELVAENFSRINTHKVKITKKTCTLVLVFYSDFLKIDRLRGMRKEIHFVATSRC